MANDLIRISTDVFEMGLHLRQLINIKFIQTFAITIEFYEFGLSPCSPSLSLSRSHLPLNISFVLVRASNFIILVIPL